jgi:hypothetical protein
MLWGFADALVRDAARVALYVSTATAAAPDALRPPTDRIPINDTWDVLEASGHPLDLRGMLRQAGDKLGNWTFTLAGRHLNGQTLVAIADTPENEPLVRAAREITKRPVDIGDLLRFVDDLLAAETAGLRGKRIWLTPARARNTGILLHTDDVFRKSPRVYPHTFTHLFIDKPPKPHDLEPAKDGEILGPRWWARFRNPTEEAAMMAALAENSPSGTFHTRVGALLRQLRRQGADVLLTTTVRHRERGYLMWGAFLLSRAENETQVRRILKMLEATNVQWNLNIAIAWQHPDGWEATVEAARRMAETYDVVYACRSGAKQSDHYDGQAVDFTAVNLPRQLTLTAPDGAERTFDLSAPHQSRDVSLTPELISWIEQHFRMKKLRKDYPHWKDAATPVPSS